MSAVGKKKGNGRHFLWCCPGELQNLRWQDWDKKAKVLRVEKSKTKNGIRSVPVIPEVALMLTHCLLYTSKPVPPNSAASEVNTSS